MNEEEQTNPTRKEVSMEVDGDDFSSDESFQELTEEDPPFN